MMELILWRHADATQSYPDHLRELSARGRLQAKAMAQWLNPRLPEKTRILVSPAQRTLQTAAALDRPFHITEAASTATDVHRLLTEINWPYEGGTTMVVGHQPTLGEVVSFLLMGEASLWSFKKASVWWLTLRERHGQPMAVVRAVMSADLVEQEK
jgi:phosphohistidine phosphatase